MGVIDWSREGERERAIVSSNVNRPRPLSCTQPFVFSHRDTAIVNIIVIVKQNSSTLLDIHIGVVYMLCSKLDVFFIVLTYRRSLRRRCLIGNYSTKKPPPSSFDTDDIFVGPPKIAMFSHLYGYWFQVWHSMYKEDRKRQNKK